ncbi:MAG: head-tail connector protein [Psychrilyobacter sp.]|uniref:head-tail connector protein n=1 Tax=Psychrilyobacter sp. TaxID=2586924 RepID=UPI003C73AABE
MLTINEMKLYLRVDESEEDTLITSLIDFSKEEIENSTGATFEDYGEKETYKMAQRVIVTDRYENRSSSDVEFKVNNIYSCLCTKLKAMVEEGDPNS